MVADFESDSRGSGLQTLQNAVTVTEETNTVSTGTH